ncbi:hypothetical protein TNCV_2724241 [Trichonephila clavipes]|nr:hypothetical protein TNCV_2724241 [Trichonephila clavipes]
MKCFTLLLAVSYKIGRCKKPRTIAEDLILPVATEIEDNFVLWLEIILLNSGSPYIYGMRQMYDIAENIHHQVFGGHPKFLGGQPVDHDPLNAHLWSTP